MRSRKWLRYPVTRFSKGMTHKIAIFSKPPKMPIFGGFWGSKIGPFPTPKKGHFLAPQGPPLPHLPTLRDILCLELHEKVVYRGGPDFGGSGPGPPKMAIFPKNPQKWPFFAFCPKCAKSRIFAKSAASCAPKIIFGKTCISTSNKRSISII